MSKHARTCGRVTVFFSLSLAFVFDGCDYPPPTGRGYSPPSTPASSLQQGFSHHLNVAKGDTNLLQAYQSPPVYAADRKTQVLFELDASRYLEGVTNDLEEIKFRSEDALRKVEAVADGTVVMGTFHHLSRMGSRIFIRSTPSNFAFIRGYPEFPYFDYRYPDPPIINDRVGMMMHRGEVLDFKATVDAYIEDGKHFIRTARMTTRQYKPLARNSWLRLIH